MAYEDLDQLMKGLAMFKGSLKELAFSRTMQGASEAVQNIKSSELAEHEQKTQIREVANKAAMNMMGMGMAPTEVEAAMNTLSPQMNQEQLLEKQQAFTASESSKNRQLQRELMAEKITIAKQNRKDKMSKGMKPSEGDVAFNTNVDVAIKGANRLEKVVSDIGNYESWWGDQDKKAILESEAHSLAVTYAKIVDPATAAREGEVEIAKKYAIPMGFGVKNSQTLAAIKLYKNKIQEYQDARKAAGQIKPAMGGAEAAGESAVQDTEEDLDSFMM